MTNLDSVLKSRDITLPRKVRLVKAMVFPVVMYGCESWTVNLEVSIENCVTSNFLLLLGLEDKAKSWCNLIVLSSQV